MVVTFRSLGRATLVVALTCIASTPAYAGEFNVPVAARVVSFQQQAPAGAVTAAIIFDPGDSESVAEASAIERQVGSGIAAGKSILRVRRVPVGQLSGLSGANVAFVTNGLHDRHGDIGAAAQRGGILTITSDLSCVTAGHCAVAVSSGAKVQITVSRAACKAARIQFGSAFLMLVKEL